MSTGAMEDIPQTPEHPEPTGLGVLSHASSSPVGDEDTNRSIQLYRMQLEELEREKEKLEKGENNVYKERCAVLENSRADEIAQAVALREYQIEAVEKLFEFNSYAADRVFENSKMELMNSMVRELQERIDQCQSRITGNVDRFIEGKTSRSLRSKRGRGDDGLNSDNKPTEIYTPGSGLASLNIALNPLDSLADMKVIYRDWKAIAQRWRQVSATALLPARVERGKLYYDQDIFNKNDTVIVFSELTKQEYTGPIVQITPVDVFVRIADGTKVKVPLQNLRMGRLSIYKPPAPGSIAAQGSLGLGYLNSLQMGSAPMGSAANAGLNLNVGLNMSMNMSQSNVGAGPTMNASAGSANVVGSGTSIAGVSQSSSSGILGVTGGSVPAAAVVTAVTTGSLPSATSNAQGTGPKCESVSSNISASASSGGRRSRASEADKLASEDTVLAVPKSAGRKKAEKKEEKDREKKKDEEKVRLSDNEKEDESTSTLMKENESGFAQHSEKMDESNSLLPLETSNLNSESVPVSANVVPETSSIAPSNDAVDNSLKNEDDVRNTETVGSTVSSDHSA